MNDAGGAGGVGNLIKRRKYRTTFRPENRLAVLWLRARAHTHTVRFSGNLPIGHYSRGGPGRRVDGRDRRAEFAGVRSTRPERIRPVALWRRSRSTESSVPPARGHVFPLSARLRQWRVRTSVNTRTGHGFGRAAKGDAENAGRPPIFTFVRYSYCEFADRPERPFLTIHTRRYAKCRAYCSFVHPKMDRLLARSSKIDSIKGPIIPNYFPA